LRGSGWSEGTLFPWVVSDFSLIDAIEAGIVKVPRVPVADDSMTGEQPTYRDLWLRIREQLPKKGRKTGEADGEPKLPVELQGALHSLYSNYEKSYRLWEKQSTDYTDLRRLNTKQLPDFNLRKSAQSADEMRGNRSHPKLGSPSCRLSR
jgi:hypothetical protein